MPMIHFRITRKLKREDFPELPRDFRAGEIVAKYDGMLSVRIGPRNVACTIKDDDHATVWQFPNEALERIQ
jgi:hypothetical protein